MSSECEDYVSCSIVEMLNDNKACTDLCRITRMYYSLVLHYVACENSTLQCFHFPFNACSVVFFYFYFLA